MKRSRITAALRVLLALALITIACLVLSNLVYPKNNQAAFGQIDEAAFGVLGEPKDSIDVLFIGDSEVYTSLSPLQMWQEQGFTSYDLSTSAQPLCYSKAILSRALEAQRPRIVVLETNMVFRSMNLDQVLWREAANILPILEYHDRWKALLPIDFTTKPKTTWSHPTKGFRPRQDVVPSKVHDHMKPTTACEEIPELNEWYMTAIIEMCRARGISVVLLSTPSTRNWNMRRHNAIKDFLYTHDFSEDVDYLDLNFGETEVPIDWDLETSDGGDHLNDKGSLKVSNAVGQWLKTSFDLVDHRNDAAYRSWMRAAERSETR